MNSERTKLTNRHIAKLLDNLEALTDMPSLAKTAVKKEMFWLAEDIEQTDNQQEQQGETREWPKRTSSS